MKLKILLTNLLFISLFATNCKKESRFTQSATDPLIEQAKSYFTDSVLATTSISNNPRAAAARTARWDQATLVDLSIGKAVVVPIKYQKELFIRTTQGGQNNFQLSNLTRLLIYQVKGAFHAEIVTSLPDTNYLKHPQGSFSGMVYTEGWSGRPLDKYLYDSKNVFKYMPHSSSPMQSLSVAPIEVCYQLTGYNYSLAEPYGGYAWAEAPVCTPSMVPLDDPMEGYPGGTDYGNVAGGGGGDGSANAFTIYPGKNTIGNIKDYLKCFTFNGANDHSYTVTICVDQPVSGSRQPWAFSGSGSAGSSWIGSNAVDVGHTFLVFSEIYGTTSVIRNIGFYPTTYVRPAEGYSSSQAQLVDDENHQYSISGTFTVNSDQFQNILSFVQLGSNKGFAYDLNSNNCTTFAINAMSAGGIYLPSTVGVWLNGQGDDPGDLGEDLRANNIPGMSLNTSIVAHPNVGTCE